MTTPTLDNVKPGDVLYYWHDTGAFGNQPYYAMVEAVTAKRVRVIGERGERGLKKPEFFYKICSREMVSELRCAYPKWPMWASAPVTPDDR